jgi:hypothetical protein
MKRKLFLVTLIFSLIGFVTSYAQNNFVFGVKAGLNVSTFGGSELENESRVGFMGGLSLDADLEKLPFLIEAGIYYTQKGPKGEYGPGLLPPGGNRGNAGNFKLEYIELPIMAKYIIETERQLQPNLIFGPYVGFKIGSKVEEGNAGGQIGTLQPYIVDISDKLNKIDAGLAIGAGSAIILNNLNLNFQAKYSIGLTPVFKDEADNGGKNRAFTLSVGITF